MSTNVNSMSVPRSAQRNDLLCFSHLRWDFVYQRPQHLLSRAARDRRVFFFEEPIFEAVSTPHLRIAEREGVMVIAPVFARAHDEVQPCMRAMLQQFVRENAVSNFTAWYYTPMSLAFTAELNPAVTVYDCMDELSMFKGAPPELREFEAELLNRAHLVFTGGLSLYEVKRGLHPNVHAFPSSIDRLHFATARNSHSDPHDQQQIAHPRLGFFGVLDERFDRDLVREVAERRPDWQFVIIGPVVKIDPADLPRAANIHYLGQKSYRDLPQYIAGWDVAILPFAINDATRFISPTKTPEYLAAGKPVVSTPITDVIRPYGQRGLVRIAPDAEAFITAVEASLGEPSLEWLSAVDAFLEGNSWDATWAHMDELIDEAFACSTADLRSTATVSELSGAQCSITSS